MSDQEYVEPTDEQLASFLSIYARTDPRLSHLSISPSILEWMFQKNPAQKAAALQIHRSFQKRLSAMAKKIRSGELKCLHIRPNGKPCPNSNKPGHIYCGLHLDEED